MLALKGHAQTTLYSEFSLENEVFKPFVCGQTVGKYVTFVAATAAATRILLQPLPDH